MTTFDYAGKRFPEYLKHGNAMQFIAPVALQFCNGFGVDVGAGAWPLPGATPIDIAKVGVFSPYHALRLPQGPFDYVFSSHCLEHLENPVAALDHWKERLKPGGVLFLHLPHPDMDYWRPQNCRKHLHLFWPADVERLVSDLGFDNVIRSERDLTWSFSVVGFK